MYSAGELIVYGTTGVCIIEEIISKITDGQPKAFYVLRPMYQKCVITIPVDSTKVFMRPVITEASANSLIDELASIEARPFFDRGVRQLTDYYEGCIRKHTCREIAELALSIYEKRRQVLELNKKLGAVDERYMKRAEELLFGELAAALNIRRDDVPEYIRTRTGMLLGE